jgi:hypothetical protein
MKDTPEILIDREIQRAERRNSLFCVNYAEGLLDMATVLGAISYKKQDEIQKRIDLVRALVSKVAA